MMPAQSMHLTAIEAARRIDEEIMLANDALQAQDLDAMLDAYVHALGLALQLGPAATERVLVAVLGTAQGLAGQQNTDGLSALGPALVDLVTQARESGGLPVMAVMEAWATVAPDLGALIGQVGLALAVAPDGREAILYSARARAVLLDEATHDLFGLSAWLDQMLVSSRL